ncbi:L-tyrosine decarboxylase [Variovorax sp. SRS16]|uniref:hypothetical protein n=1 Tax=Variovorax sp. SRS16 TaxID=282217 RepID=UPI0013182CED|nr:hypothetical protein [Variovorax sp. SRS16]VTU25870.1 L-tyrosine decarboxylase [Variovorax sp. SRS16]
MTTMQLPKQGVPWAELEPQLKAAGEKDVAWRDGRAPAFVHYAGDDVLEVAKKACLMYFSENGLGLRAFHGLAKFESEVVAMGLGLLHGSEAARGAMTTGGTESIFLAVKAARDAARERGAGKSTPRIVLPYSAHPAFDFSVPGVRSISADLHKYGYAAKGASTTGRAAST